MYYIHIHITDTNITKDTNFTNLLEGLKGSRNQKIQALRLCLNRGLTTTTVLMYDSYEHITKRVSDMIGVVSNNYRSSIIEMLFSSERKTNGIPTNRYS